MTFTRREWLAAVAASATSLRAAEPVRLRFGFSLYGMKSLPLPEALKTCAAIGYDGVEFALMPGWPTEPKALSPADRRGLRSRLGDHRLGVYGLMENLAEPADDRGHRANLDRLKAAAELGHDLSPDSPPVIETVLGGKPGDWDRLKDRMADRLRAWAAVARDSKTVIAIKPHVANALHTVEGVLWLLKAVDSPWLKLAFDYSHFALQKVSLAHAVTLIPHAAFAHVKDAKGVVGKFEFLLPGDGDIDYRELAKQLRAAKYTGPVVVEVSAQISNRLGYDPVAAAKKCFTNVAGKLN